MMQEMLDGPLRTSSAERHEVIHTHARKQQRDGNGQCQTGPRCPAKMTTPK